MKRRASLLSACIILTVVGIIGFNLWQNHGTSYASGNSTASASSSTRSSTKATTTSNASTTQALASIQTLLANNSDLDISVSLTDLQTGATYHYGDSTGFNAASIIKLISAVTFLHQVEQGNASLDDDVGDTTAQDDLQKMIVDSDNDAWTNIENEVTLSAQQSYAQSLGLTSYDADNNIITSDDVSLLLAKLWQGKILNTSNTQLILSWMEQANYRDFIVAAAPSNVTVYHKVGILDDRLHDAAIIKKGNHAYVLTIFSKDNSGSYDYSRGTGLFGSITKDSLAAFFGTS